MSKLPSTGPSLQRYLRQQARSAERLVNSSAFARSGTAVTAEGVTTVDGELDVAGTLNVTGNTVIGGTLSLPNGIVDNAALANPVIPQAVSFSGAGSLTTAYSTATSVTVTVPAGFTSAVVTASGSVVGNNPGTTGGADTVGGDFLGCRLAINGVEHGSNVPGFAQGGGGWGVGLCSASEVLPGLTPGGTFTLSMVAGTSYFSWGSGSTWVNGTILWFR